MVITILQYVFIFSIIILSALLAVVEQRFNFSLNLKKVAIFVLVILISFTSAIRTVGTDTENYVNIYLTLPRISNLNLEFFQEVSYEPGFVLIASALKTIGIGVQGFFFIYALIPLIIISSIIFKVDNKNAFLSFFIFTALFILRGPLDIIRQFFAMSILLVAIYELSKKDTIKYYLYSLFSVFFHYSSIIILFIKNFLIRRVMRKSNYMLFSLGAFLIGIISREFILENLASYSATFPAANKVVGYLLSSYQYDNTIHFISRLLLEHSLPWINIGLILYFLSKPKIIQMNSINIISFNAMLLGSFLYFFCMGLGESTIAVRLSYMLSIGLFILVKDLLVFEPTEEKYITWILILIFYNIVVLNYYSSAYKIFY